MIEKNKKVHYAAEKAVIIGVITQQQSQDDVKEYLDELAFLAETAGAIRIPSPKNICGKRKTRRNKAIYKIQ